jgi:Family of unknown function (DUF6527)
MSNDAGGLYNDEQAKLARPEHDPKQFYGPYIVQETFDGWDCQQNIAVLESDSAGCILAVWHVCPCGCRGNRRLPVNGHTTEEGAGWAYSVDEENRLTMSPSIQDLGTCRSHYFIRDGMVEFC